MGYWVIGLLEGGRKQEFYFAVEGKERKVGKSAVEE